MSKKLFSDISTVHFTAIYYIVMVSYLVGSLSMVIFICKEKKKLFTDISAITRHAREQFRENNGEKVVSDNRDIQIKREP